MPSVWRGPITCRRGSIPHRLTGAVVGFLSTASTTRIPPVRCPRTGESAPLTITEQSRGGGGGGTTKYEVRYECTQRGAHSIHVQLRGEEIVGSPVNFDVLSAAADPTQCKLIMPKTEVLYANVTHTIVLDTYDKFGNRCNGGGLSTNVRLQLIKQGIHDQTMLMPNNHEVNINDNNDGTYHVDIKTIKIAANIKVIVNMDKNIPAAGGELPAVFVSIVAGEPAAPSSAAKPAAAAAEVVDITDAPDAEEAPATAPEDGAASPADKKSPNRRNSTAGRSPKKGAKETLQKAVEVATGKPNLSNLSKPMDSVVAAMQVFADGSSYKVDQSTIGVVSFAG